MITKSAKLLSSFVGEHKDIIFVLGTMAGVVYYATSKYVALSDKVEKLEAVQSLKVKKLEAVQSLEVKKLEETIKAKFEEGQRFQLEKMFDIANHGDYENAHLKKKLHQQLIHTKEDEL